MSPLTDDETDAQTDEQLNVPRFSPLADAVTPPAAEPMATEPVAPVGEQTPAAPPDGSDHPMFGPASQTPGIYVRSTNYAKSGRDKAGSDPDTDAGRTSTGGPLLEATDKVAGTAAVDPKVIPYGSIIRAANGQVYVAGDTGGAVKSMVASGGKAPVIDLFNGEHHPDYQNVQIYAPAANYLGLTPEQKLAYHQQAAETFHGLPAGVQLATSPGQVDPNALTPESIQAAVAAAAGAPGGMEAGSRRGPLSSAIPAKGGNYSSDSERREVRGRFFQDNAGAWSFTPNSALPENQRGEDVNDIPSYITKTMPDGSRQTFHSDDYGQAQGNPIKNIPAAQIPVADLLKSKNLPEAMAGDILAKVAASGGTGARGRSVADIVGAVRANVDAGMSPAEALEAIKIPDQKAVTGIKEKFNNQPAVKKMVETGGMLDAYNEIQRLAAIPQAQRTVTDDHILMDAIQRISTPGRQGTVADRAAMGELGGLKAKFMGLKNMVVSNNQSRYDDADIRAVKDASDRVIQGNEANYTTEWNEHRKLLQKMGADPADLGPNIMQVLKDQREALANKPTAAAATPGAPPKVAAATTTPGNVYIPPTAMGADQMVKMIGSDGVAYRIPFANVDKAVAKGFKVAP